MLWANFALHTAILVTLLEVNKAIHLSAEDLSHAKPTNNSKYGEYIFGPETVRRT